MRKESSNQFTEGLVCDLNPINTPNTALTDALNATIITYDGNEYSLQNDRGNYPLKHCRLQPNYIPVGIKEYGDILYIVSYNPLNETVEIGSYPSPLNVEDSETEKTASIGDVKSLISEIRSDVPADYADLIEKQHLYIYTGDGDEEDFKIYPGDEYSLAEITSPYKYEGVEYFIVDENRKKHNVSDMILFGDDWFHTKWQVPGWLAFQYTIANFEDFNCNIRSFKIPKLSNSDKFNGELKLNFQFKISDELLLKESTLQDDVFIDLKIVNAKNIIYHKTISLSKESDGYLVEWYRDSKILGINETIDIKDLSQADVLTIEATPSITVAKKGSETKIISYPNLKATQSISVKNIGTIDQFKFAENIWKFYTDPDGDSLYIEYDVSGPTVTTSEVELVYRIWTIDGKQITDNWEKVTDYTGIGDQNISAFKFNKQFIRENMYIFEFAFKADGEVFDKNSIRRLVITSSIFGKFNTEYDNFNQITFDEWAVAGYKDRLSVKNMTASPTYKENSSPAHSNYKWNINGELVDSSGTVVYSDPILQKLWNNTNKEETKGWVLSSKVNDVIGKQLVVKYEKDYDTSIKVGFEDGVLLEEGIWANVPRPILTVADDLKTFKDVVLTNNDISKGVTLVGVTSRGEEQTFVTNVKGSNFSDVGNNVRDVTKIKKIAVTVNFDKSGANDKMTFNVFNKGEYDFRSMSETTGSSYQVASLEVSETSQPIGNTISRAIQNQLKGYDVGFLTLQFNKMYNKTNKTKLLHGGTEEAYLKKSDYDNADSYGFCYLIFNISDKNHVVGIPIRKDNYWNKKNLSINVSGLKDAFNSMFGGVKICEISKALSNYRLLSIESKGIKTLSNNPYFVKLQLPELLTWNISYNKGVKNLLSVEDRDYLISQLNNGVKSVCGELLTSGTSSIDEVVLSELKLYNRGEANISSVKMDWERSINAINNNVSEPKREALDKTILNKMNQRSNHRGVYTASDNSYSELLTILDDCYRATSEKNLVGNKMTASELKVLNVGDNDYLIVSAVTTGLSI